MSKYKYQHSAKTLAEWTALNPVILKDEIIIVSDMNYTMIGNGLPFNDLKYQNQDIIEALGNGSPKGSFANEAALISANPDHTYTYVTTDTGKWYFYSTTLSAWTIGGQYQAALSVVGTLGYDETKLIHQKKVSEELGKKKIKSAYIINTSPTLYPTFTQTTATLPAGLFISAEGYGFYSLPSEIVLTFANTLTHIYFDFVNKVFDFEGAGLFTKYNNAGYVLFAIIRTGDVIVNSRYYSYNSLIVQNFSIYNPNLNLQDRGVFESIPVIASDVKTVFVNGVLSVKIYSENPSVRYTLVRLSKGGGEEIILYKTGTSTSALRIPQGGLIDIGNNLRRYYGAMITDGAYIDIIVDWRIFTQEVQSYVNVSSNAVFSQRNYNEKNRELQQLKLATKYCSTGASTSTYPWQDAVAAALGYSYAKYGVGGCKWTHNADSVLTTSATPATKDNIMSNQLARLLSDKTNNSYSPDIITIMCGLNELYAGLDLDTLFGDLDTILALDFTDVTVSDFFTSAEWTNVRNKIYGAMRFYIENVIRNFPTATIYFMTVQDLSINNSLQYYVKKLNDNMKLMAGKYGLPIIDINGEACMPAYGGISDLFLSDGIHPNNEGSLVLKNFVLQKIKSNYYSRK